MPSNFDDDRYHDLLQLIGELRIAIDAAREKTEAQLLEHWKAVSIAIRTLTDWWVADADRNDKERKEWQAALDARLDHIEAGQAKAHDDRERLQIMVYVLAGMVLVVLVLVVGARWL